MIKYFIGPGKKRSRRSPKRICLRSLKITILDTFYLLGTDKAGRGHVELPDFWRVSHPLSIGFISAIILLGRRYF